MSVAAVAIGEMGDKTQLLALMLSARFRRPAPIVAGILVATLLNHSLAALLGNWLGAWLSPAILRWVIGISFLGMAIWMLIPDKIEEGEIQLKDNLGAFSATVLAFFMAEMGDKTQIATMTLAARYHDLFAVVGGTTLGMLIADVPAVFIGDKLGHRIPIPLVHGLAALLFALLGLLALFNVGHLF